LSCARRTSCSCAGTGAAPAIPNPSLVLSTLAPLPAPEARARVSVDSGRASGAVLDSWTGARRRLAEEYPDRAVAWFAVGCYYLCVGQHESARRFFGKATALDAGFAPAWLGFGHAFAAQDESDQARPGL
jgi:tetratricopeptide (TPR) repeat protein